MIPAEQKDTLQQRVIDTAHSDLIKSSRGAKKNDPDVNEAAQTRRGD
jgi:hypothetical protein